MATVRYAQILHNGERVGALWDLPGCFITSRVTLQTPNSMANRKASSVTMSVYSNGEMQMRKKDVPADCNWAGKYISYASLCWKVFCTGARAEDQLVLLKRFGLSVAKIQPSLPGVPRLRREK